MAKKGGKGESWMLEENGEKKRKIGGMGKKGDRWHKEEKEKVGRLK